MATRFGRLLSESFISRPALGKPLQGLGMTLRGALILEPQLLHLPPRDDMAVLGGLLDPLNGFGAVFLHNLAARTKLAEPQHGIGNPLRRGQVLPWAARSGC